MQTTRAIEKCRQAQLSNFSLVLVFYALDKSAGMNTLQCNDQSAELLMKLFGVDKGRVKKNLNLIIGKKRSHTPRKLTEIQNGFSEAYKFFDELKFSKGVRILEDLELRCTRQSI